MTAKVVDQQQARLARLTALVEEKREHEAAIRRLKAEIGPLEEWALDWLTSVGLKHARTQDGHTVYLSRTEYLAQREGASVVAALQAAGLTDCYVASPSQALTKLRSRWKADAESVPKDVMDAVSIEERWSIGVRRSDNGKG